MQQRAAAPRRTPRERGPFTRALAQALREAIGKADISRAEAGRRSGVPESTLYGLLKGEDPIDMEQARKLAKGLNVPLVSIILRAEEIMADASADPAADR